jgi:hypothetical protein
VPCKWFMCCKQTKVYFPSTDAIYQVLRLRAHQCIRAKYSCIVLTPALLKDGLILEDWLWVNIWSDPWITEDSTTREEPHLRRSSLLTCLKHGVDESWGETEIWGLQGKEKKNAGMNTVFVWFISHQLAVLFSQNKSDTNNQLAVLLSENKPALATSQTNRLEVCSSVTKHLIVKS